MYWRLISTDPAAAKDVVLSEKPPISTETDRMDRGMLDQLLLHTGTLSSIYHKSPQTFIRMAKARYLTDSPALNSSTRRHLQTGHGLPAAVVPPSQARPPVVAPPLPTMTSSTTTPAPPLPQRTATSQSFLDEDDPEQEEDSSPRLPSNGRPPQRPQQTDDLMDPYGALGAFDQTQQGYQVDAPVPRQAGRDDLLF